ncbi:signal transduction protein [Spongiactinospora gelatinilytica]|uniref:Signal transduction protein n=1 Tax=Spongiactinospora gelatinilytica TaxID=2666298 RepID=A0A2W2HPF9_9ACTN|nr:CBS domain-containing protein [Spongiactinospora gelatinilytica]PZG57009.1 signal transduction protein [Spongiactinospora gelatinilytica]
MWMKVGEVMSGCAVAVCPDTSFGELIATIRRFDAGALTVVDEARRPVGVVSEHDLLSHETDPYRERDDLFEGHASCRDHLKARGCTARELMTTPPIMVTRNTTVREAARLMADHRVKQLPVVDTATGVLVGAVSQRDLLTVFVRSAEAIRLDADELLRRLSVPEGDVVVEVLEGVATVKGRLARRSQIAAVVESIRGVEGLIEVIADLDCATDDLDPQT